MDNNKKYFVETRADGLPWTRQGCNPFWHGVYFPWESIERAQVHINELKQQDDPMWSRAEYRIVES